MHVNKYEVFQCSFRCLSVVDVDVELELVWRFARPGAGVHEEAGTGAHGEGTSFLQDTATTRTPKSAVLVKGMHGMGVMARRGHGDGRLLRRRVGRTTEVMNLFRMLLEVIALVLSGS